MYSYFLDYSIRSKSSIIGVVVHDQNPERGGWWEHMLSDQRPTLLD